MLYTYPKYIDSLQRFCMCKINGHHLSIFGVETVDLNQKSNTQVHTIHIISVKIPIFIVLIFLIEFYMDSTSLLLIRNVNSTLSAIILMVLCSLTHRRLLIHAKPLSLFSITTAQLLNVRITPYAMVDRFSGSWIC